eukprot:1465702-Rhodomonas_salina.1
MCDADGGWGWTGPACIAEPFSYKDMLVFKTLGPIILALILALPWLFVTIRKWRHDDKPIMAAGRRPDDGDDEEDDTPTYFQVHEGTSHGLVFASPYTTMRATHDGYL